MRTRVSAITAALLAAVPIAALLALTGAAAGGCGGGNDTYSPALVGGAQGVRVTVTPPNPTIAPGAEILLAATVTGASDTSVTWSVQESEGGSVDPDGDYTAPLTPGTYHVVATSVADPSQHAVAAVTVQAPGSLDGTIQ